MAPPNKAASLEAFAILLRGLGGVRAVVQVQTACFHVGKLLQTKGNGIILDSHFPLKEFIISTTEQRRLRLHEATAIASSTSGNNKAAGDVEVLALDRSTPYLQHLLLGIATM